MKSQPATVTDEKAKLLPRLTLAVFNRPRTAALIWIVITIFGIISYATLLKREGFPSVAIPIVIVSGAYAVNDAAEVDKTLAAPVSEIASKQEGVKSVSTQSEANFFSATVQYEEKTNAEAAKKALQKALAGDSRIAGKSQLNVAAPYFGVTGGSIEKVDATISVFSKDSSISKTELIERTRAAVEYMQQQKPPKVASFEVAEQFQEITNPITGELTTVQRSFDRFGERADGKTTFYPSVIINVASVPGADVIELDDEISGLLARVESSGKFEKLDFAISASYAPTIKDEISELQTVLLEGLLAVLVVGSIIIAVRASLITVLSMLTVIAITLGLIYVLGYTLNVITLFALILGLALIVDDTIIMVEALDSARRRHKDRRAAVEEATRKISRAMIAATLTAALSFAPLLFVGGVLGSFIRAIPVTIISALLISLAVALFIIPLFARFILLGNKQMGSGNVTEVAHNIETKIASFISRPMLWARHSRRKEFAVGIVAVLIGLTFIGIGGFMFQKVAFNIFPPSKDANQLSVSLTFPPGTTVAEAEKTAQEADDITSKALGENLVEASYYGMANDQTALLYVELIPYGKRDITAPELEAAVEKNFASFSAAKVDVAVIGVGPPSSSFKIDINATDRQQAERLARDMADYLKGKKLIRLSGEKATITEVSVANTTVFNRLDNKPIISVNATFDDTDTTTLTGLASNMINDYYDDSRLGQYGLKTGDITFDIGQESENQDSFKSLAIAFPILLVAIYILLVIQFRSLAQPLLIFMALPFSLFGISLGLFYTNNAFSFFSMLGFFALIGLSIKNTILLTDYANQARRAGMPAVDAAVEALGERFRPLVATSLTAVVSLIPLALTSPFWESLAVTLIFGLLSSTLLVITVFPYYYLGAEYLRLKISRKAFFVWLLLNVLVIGVLFVVFDAPLWLIIVAVLATNFGLNDYRRANRPARSS